VGCVYNLPDNPPPPLCLCRINEILRFLQLFIPQDQRKLKNVQRIFLPSLFAVALGPDVYRARALIHEASGAKVLPSNGALEASIRWVRGRRTPRGALTCHPRPRG
jgi:hypothetical protein